MGIVSGETAGSHAETIFYLYCHTSIDMATQSRRGRRFNIPTSALLLFALGVGCLVGGQLLVLLGLPAEAGIAVALALIFIVVAVLTYAIIWVLGKLD